MNKKQIIYISIVIVCILIIIFTVFLKLVIKQPISILEPQASNQNELEKAINNVIKESDNAVNEMSRKIIINNGMYNLAVKHQNLETCDLIENPLDAAYCQKKIAILFSDVSMCDSIVNFNDIKLECQEEISFSKITESNNIKLCEDLTEEIKRKICIKTIINNLNDTNFCDDLKDKTFKNECYNTVGLNQAIAENNINSCDLIKDFSQRADCYVALTGYSHDYDGDWDGLGYWDEIYYGSHPEIADSDFDGFSDGDEVKSGHSPIGKGLISDIIKPE